MLLSVCRDKQARLSTPTSNPDSSLSMDFPLDAAYATGLCYFLTSAEWKPVIAAVLILLFTSRNTVQLLLAAPSVLPRYIAATLERAIELSILEYIAWLISSLVIMYQTYSIWEKLLMIIPILAFFGCIVLQMGSPLHHRSQTEMNVPVRDAFVSVGDYRPELLRLDHPLSKFVVNTKMELANAHSILRSFAAASVDIHCHNDITWAVQKYSRYIVNRYKPTLRFVSPRRFNPDSPIFPPPLGPRYTALNNEAEFVEIPWPWERIPSAIWIDRRLASMWEDERQTEPPPPRGYSGQCDLFLKAVICHEMLKTILIDVEKNGHLPDDD
ncbi:uncharacterized protein EDB91DRAFT_838526 [Suillus paluster]|uniref:uncharacterized protein n=1 Tax=Suillus paluster TaxID=48578 RepID=UPI001B87016A|nr:uncharacterized protein EDB91DRAFT_838526 [Suillus paluster]KAG1729075.1 hypothetical protein EDB91DRAFT_838526 [Suillus paluster]